jgi:hypothetical protein
MSILETESLQKLPQHVDRWIWQQCSAKRTLLLFMIPLLLALAASSLLPQIPAYVRTNPISYQERLAAIQVQFRNWTPFLEAIGAFSIQDTLWFRLLLAVVAFVLLVSLGQEISDLIAVGSVDQADKLILSAETSGTSTSLPQEQAVQAVRETIESHVRHVHSERKNDRVYLYGGHATWAKAGMAVSYLGMLFLIAGLAINGRWGWRHTDVQLPPNESISIGPGGSHSIQLLEVHTGPEETLEVVADGSRPISIRWGTRSRRGRFGYQWVSRGGPFVRLYAQRSDGTKLTLYNYEPRPSPQETLQFAFGPQASQEEGDRLFIVAENKVVGRLAWENEGDADSETPHFHLWTFGEDGLVPLADQQFGVAEDSASGDTLVAQLDDVTYVLEVARYVVVDVAHQPGLWSLWFGGVLLAGGLAINVVPRRQIWASIAPAKDGHEVRMRTKVHSIGGWKRQQPDRPWAELCARVSSTRGGDARSSD